MNNIVILGAGGFAREVAWLIEDINVQDSMWNLIGYVEESDENVGKNLNGFNVIGDFSNLKDYYDGELYYVCAVGDPNLKVKFSNKAKELGMKPAILIHPNVKISKYNKIGDGAIICAGCIITVNATIGEHVILNIDTTVGHDSVIGNYSTVLPSVNISGNVVLGENCNIGTATSIINKVNIGTNVTIGAGAVVVKDIPSNCTAVGIPAKPIKFY
ncbi:acetyltransferase [Clostridium sp. YIM B02551]|uniref:acetyltransferase n=1 Tax=Clostridium sp. YIM B02551 TaxID=2910679 RepID=UPI001EEB3B10|nr:acetyltransferase [Clostridium sp. YIM B02551]